MHERKNRVRVRGWPAPMLVLAACAATASEPGGSPAGDVAAPAPGAALPSGHEPVAGAPATDADRERSDLSLGAVAGSGAIAPAPSEATPRAPSAPRGSPGCDAAKPAATGMVSFDFAGALGTYLLHVPPSYAGEPTALVINLHGAPGTGAIEEMSTGMSPVADARGFVVAYPDGGFAWHSAPNFGGPRDDVAFIGALIDHVGETMCIDLARVYATGHSAGGWMVYRLACDLSDRLAAVAPVAGGFLFDPAMCAPARAVPLMHFHGTVDPRVPYDAKSTAMGPPGAMLTPGVESVAKWAEITGCDAEPTTTFEKSDWTCLGYGGCAGGADVTLCSIEGMGHPWPGGDPGAGFGPIGVAIVGPASMTLNASEYMWDALFSRHSL